MKTLSLEQMENVEGGKFFGVERTGAECINGRKAWACTEFFTFWISWGQKCDTDVPC